MSNLDILQTIVQHLKSIMPAEMESMINPDTSFIEMGLDSLLMASLELYLQKHFGVETGFLIRHKNIRECVNELSSSHVKLINPTYTLSHAQKRLIFSVSTKKPLEKLVIKIPNLDKEKFVNAWRLISSRHSILRTRLSLTGQTISEYPIEINNSSSLDILECPLRVFLNDDSIKLEYHHALIDGTSINLLMSELQDAYEHLEEVIKRPIPLQYYEYCLFEESHFIENNKKIIDYWTNELKGFEGIVDEEINGTKQMSTEVEIGSQLSQKLFNFAQKNQLTIFNLMSGLLRLLFYKLYDTSDLIIAFPIEQRLNSEFEKTIGLFMNLNLCRFQLNAEKTIVEFLKDVAQKTLESRLNGHIPFNKLINYLQSNGTIESESQLLQLIAVDDKQMSNDVEVETISHSMNYPQIWYFQHNKNGGIKLRIEFDGRKFEEQKIRDELKYFELICRKLIEEDLTTRVNEICLVEHLVTNVIFPTVDDFLEKILGKLNELRLDKVVLIGSDRQMFDAQTLLNEIWVVAANLKEIIGENNGEVFIALMLPRSPQLIISLLGAWLNGFIVIPLNYNKSDVFDKLPKNTFLIIDQQSNFSSKIIQIQQLFIENRNKSRNESRKLPNFNPNDLCYATFTSGSVGEPKLVLSERIGISNLLKNYTQKFNYNEESVVYQVVNPAFDIFLADLVVSLANGGTLILAKHQIPSIGEIEKYKITHAYIMPAYLPQLCCDQDLQILSKLHILLFGGELPNETFIKRALEFKIPMVQLFGFTEHAVYTNYNHIKEVHDYQFIGTPFEGTKIVIVDKDGQLKPDGFEGELASLGIGLSRGYYGMCSKEFRKINGNRAFLSGDICLKNNNNKGEEKIEFLGRRDGIVKIRGHKVQLNAVDKMLSQIDGINQCKTIVEKGTIVSFIVTKMSIDEIQQKVMTKYPDWSIQLKQINKLPLTSNGKTDKKQLIGFESVKYNFESVKNNTDDSLLSIFQKYLGSNYKLEDEFLSAGIDSIQLLQVVQELDEKYKIELDVRNAFKSKNARKWLETKSVSRKVKVDELIGPTTWNQEHIWLLKDFDNTSNDSYKIKLKLEFFQKINEDHLNRAIEKIVEMNESLRVRVEIDPKDGQLKQAVLDEKVFPFEILSNNSIKIEFDHSIIDGYSLRKIVEDLYKLYKHPLSELTTSIFSPIEFAKEQRAKKFDRELEFFRSEFLDILQDSPMKTELPRNNNTTKEAGHQKIKFKIGDFNKSKFNLFYLALTAYLKQLSVELVTNPLIIGIPFANRSANNVNAIGYFANSLPIKFDVDGKSNFELLEYVQEKVLKTLEFSEIPFAFLVRKLQPKRDQFANPIFQRMIMFEDFSIQTFEDLFKVHEIESTHAKFDQTWHIYRSEDNLHIHVEFDKNLFTPNGVKQSLDGFCRYFNQILNEGRGGVKLKVLQFFKDELVEVSVDNEEVNEKSNFFELGGHSLNAARVAGRIRMETGLECSTRLIFENQTVEELVNVLEQQINDKPQLHEVSFIQSTILRAIRNDNCRVLKEQYCIKFCIKIEDKSQEEITQLLFKMIKEQEALRTTFIVKNGTFMSQILPISKKFQLPYVVKSKDFNMEVVYIDLNEDKLHFQLSHLITDGHSTQIMMTYLNKSSNSGKIPKLTQFNRRFNEICRKSEENNRNFWSPILNKPYVEIFKDNHKKENYKSASISLIVRKDEFIKKLKNEKISPNSLFLYNLASTLKYWQSNDDELYIGIVKDMRSEIPNSNFEETIGFFAQSLPIPCKNRNLKELDSLLFDVYENSFVTYEFLLELSSRSSLFEVMLVVDFEDGIESSGEEVNGKFPLTFYVKVGRMNIAVKLVYWKELWEKDSVLSMLEMFGEIIEGRKVG